jgi:hypothetical protein
MVSAPAIIPTTSELTFAPALAPTALFTRTCLLTSSSSSTFCSNRTAGTNPACDTKFASSNRACVLPAAYNNHI